MSPELDGSYCDRPCDSPWACSSNGAAATNGRHGSALRLTSRGREMSGNLGCRQAQHEANATNHTAEGSYGPMSTGAMTSVTRPGEIAIELPGNGDAQIYFIGRIRTPYPTLADCPKNPLLSTCEARVEIDPRYAAGLEGIEGFSHVYLIYWMDASRRDLVRQTPRHAGRPRGVFSLRSPLRPNPLALTVVELKSVAGNVLRVGGIDCRDGTPLIDIKPYLASIDSVPDARRP